jgi:lysyl-tRNA synthetase class 2
MALEIKRFKSTAILWGGYDAERQMLVLCFTSNPNMEYDYPRVPDRIWTGLVAARSKGQYYNAHIRDTYGADRIGRQSLRRFP